MSWYPLGHGDASLINEPAFAELGDKYGKTPAQIILRWHRQMGFVVIPGSKNVDHIKDNLDILDFALTEDEMAKIAKLDKDERYYHRTDEQLVQFAGWKPAEGAAKAVELELTGDEIAWLEEPYVPHPLAGVMAQNKPAAAKEKHVWSTGDQKITAN